MSDEKDKGVGDSWLEDIFPGLPKYTEEERAQQERERIERRNEGFRESYEREKERREKRIWEDDQIRRIAGEEISKTVYVFVAIGFAYGVNKDYGTLGSVGVMAVYFFWLWWSERSKKHKPFQMLDGVDELAEKAVTHQRIVELEHAGKPWIVIEDGYAEYHNLFDHPYWEQVNTRVREYRALSFVNRNEASKAARKASLPFRIAMEQRLKAENIEMLYDVRVCEDERSG